MRGHLARVTENLNLNIKMVTYRTTRDRAFVTPKEISIARTLLIIVLFESLAYPILLRAIGC